MDEEKIVKVEETTETTDTEEKTYDESEARVDVNIPETVDSTVSVVNSEAARLQKQIDELTRENVRLKEANKNLVFSAPADETLPLAANSLEQESEAQFITIDDLFE